MIANGFAAEYKAVAIPTAIAGETLFIAQWSYRAALNGRKAQPLEQAVAAVNPIYSVTKIYEDP